MDDNVEIIKLNPQSANDYDIIEMSKLQFTKPTVFCLSGNGAITLEIAHGITKFAERYLDLPFKTKTGTNTLQQVDIMSVKYAPIENNSNIGTLTNEALLKISDALLALLVDNNGNRFTLDQAKQNMSRVTFFTFCAGDAELQRIFKIVNHNLLKSGYTQQEVIAINNATLNVSFAPYDYKNNLIPSVNIISLNDETTAKHLDHVLTKKQQENLDGIYLHQDQPGWLYGVANHNATAGNIQIISSSLINNYEADGMNEHYLSMIALDENWNIKPWKVHGEDYRAGNATCTAQLIAEALSDGVMNSIENFHAQHYVPNTYWNQLIHNFQTNIKTFAPEKLARHPIRVAKLRKENFDTKRYRKQLKLTKELRNFVPSPKIVKSELKNAQNFIDVMSICEKFDYYHTNNFNEFNFLTADEKLALNIAKTNRRSQQAARKSLNQPNAEVLEQFKKATCFYEVVKLAIRHEQYAMDILPELTNSNPEYQYYLSHEEFEYIQNIIKQKKT